LDDLGAPAHRPLADPGAQAVAIGGDGAHAPPCQREKPFRCGSAIRVFQAPLPRSCSTLREW
jgi:hypothetical protein